ncbi:translation initiation factor SUI1, partial [Verticillium alfalfae VaMs.102]
MTTIENLKTIDPFADADEGDTNDAAATKQSQSYIHIRIQQRNGRKTLTTIQGLPRRFDQKKILKVIKKKFACNGTIVEDSEMGDVIQLQGDQRKAIHEFLIDKKEGLEMDAKDDQGPRLLRSSRLRTHLPLLRSSADSPPEPGDLSSARCHQF